MNSYGMNRLRAWIDAAPIRLLVMCQLLTWLVMGCLCLLVVAVAEDRWWMALLAGVAARPTAYVAVALMTNWRWQEQ